MGVFFPIFLSTAFKKYLSVRIKYKQAQIVIFINHRNILHKGTLSSKYHVKKVTFF